MISVVGCASLCFLCPQLENSKLFVHLENLEFLRAKLYRNFDSESKEKPVACILILFDPASLIFFFFSGSS